MNCIIYLSPGLEVLEVVDNIALGQWMSVWNFILNDTRMLRMSRFKKFSHQDIAAELIAIKRGDFALLKKMEQRIPVLPSQPYRTFLNK
jgi:hypothetical protein